jgi:putative heme-binding domain-containing protein
MRRLILPAALLLVCAAPLAAQLPDDAALAAGARLFESQCTRCHGVGGTGGVGPALNHPKLRRAPNDETLVQVILAGVPGTAMIGFWNLSSDEATQVAAYIRSLGRRPPEVIPGDAESGRRLYEGPGKCGSCHIMNGKGSGWAPDLSDAGLRLSAAQLRQSLTDPGAAQPISPLPSVHGPYPAYLMIEATTAAGEVIHGTRVTEDDFTIVVRELSGRLRSLEKTRLRRLQKLPGQSPMPSFRESFTPGQLDDVVAWLASQRGEP